MAQCFYCGASLRIGNGHHDERHTLDHVYPRWLIAQLTPEQRQRLPVDFYVNNQVPCCGACNKYKGALHPLDWLVIMPSAQNASHLAERLIKMGEDMEEVFLALRRRRK